MFDIGFSELLLIGVVALVVIGPERLPKVARTVGALLGRLNRYVSDVKGDIDREMRLEELRKLQDEMKASAQKYEILASEAGQEVKREVDQVDKVIQAMSLTDGGLSQREYEKDKAERVVAEASSGSGGLAEPEASTESGALAEPGALPSGAAPDRDEAETKPAARDEAETKPAARDA